MVKYEPVESVSRPQNSFLHTVKQFGDWNTFLQGGPSRQSVMLVPTSDSASTLCKQRKRAELQNLKMECQEIRGLRDNFVA